MRKAEGSSRAAFGADTIKVGMCFDNLAVRLCERFPEGGVRQYDRT
jgi:hypothetical protein